MTLPHPLLPPELDAKLRRAVRLQWTTLAFLASIVAVMYLAMGGSQAMRTAFWEDLLSFVPPLAFLVGLHFERRRPTRAYPYGFLGSATIASLVAACALLGMGAWLFIGALRELLSASRPSIGAMTVLGHTTWAGWWMLAALAYSAVPPVLLGRMKVPLAEALQDDTLHADADMNKADWRTAVAAGLGVLGIGAGLWWADAVAAGLISFSVLKDGALNLWRAVRDLIDHEPVDVHGRPLRLDEGVRAELERLPWVARWSARFREEGRFVTGQVRFTPPPGVAPTPRELDEARARLLALDWRIHNITWAPLPEGAGDLELRWVEPWR